MMLSKVRKEALVARRRSTPAGVALELSLPAGPDAIPPMHPLAILAGSLVEQLEGHAVSARVTLSGPRRAAGRERALDEITRAVEALRAGTDYVSPGRSRFRVVARLARTPLTWSKVAAQYGIMGVHPEKRAREAPAELRLPPVPPEWRAAVDAVATQLRAELPRDAEEFRSFFAAVNTALDYVHNPIILALGEYLAALDGYSFGSLEANQAFTRALRETLNRLQLRIRCPQADCGQPGTLHCPSPKGDFRIAHEGANATRHLGRMVLPPLELVAPPADRRLGPK